MEMREIGRESWGLLKNNCSCTPFSYSLLIAGGVQDVNALALHSIKQLNNSTHNTFFYILILYILRVKTPNF